MASNSEEDEQEETLIYMDFNTKMDDDLFSADKELKIIGLDEDTPILQLGNQVFRGEWRDTMGTHIFLEESKTVPVYDPIFTDVPETYMQYSCMTSKILHMSRIFLKPGTESSADSGSKETEEQNELRL